MNKYYQLENKNKISYEKNRLLHKNGSFSAIILILKSSLGLGILMNQYYFGKTGLILSPIILIIVSIIILYSFYLLLKIADNEEKNFNNKIENYDQLGKIVFGPWFQYFI